MNRDKNFEAINDRLDSLEKKVDGITDRLGGKISLSGRLSKIVSDDSLPGEESIIKSGSWFNRAGIGLFLIGAAYFFKYAVEQGWIIPAVRIALGFILGSLLMWVGFKVQERNRTFSQVMLGGGIALYYITVFAAFHIEKIFPYPVSFLLMVFVTILAFFLSLKYSDQALSVIGVLGGFGTPFILYTGAGDYIFIVIYACVIFTGSCFLFLYRGWPLLLWVSMAGSWLVFGSLNYAALAGARESLFSETVAAQAGIAVTWLLQWMTQSGRGLAGFRSPERGADNNEPMTGSSKAAYKLLFLISPLASLMLSSRLWGHPRTFWGMVSLVLAGFYLSAFFFLRKRDESGDAAHIQWKISLALLTYSLLHLFEGNMLLLSLSAEALLLHLIISKNEDRALFAGGNILFIVIRFWIAYRLIFSAVPDSPFHPDTMSNVFAIAALMASIRFIFNRTYARLYFVSTYILLMIWLWQVISLISDVPGYVTISWCICAVVLFTAGVMRKSVFLSRVSLCTLLTVVIKLLFYDITRLGTIYKVLIFSGMGLFLLAISYAVQAKILRHNK